MFKQYCFLNLKCCCPFTKKTNSFVFLLFIDSLWISQHTSRSHSFPYPFSSALCHCKLASAQQNLKVTTKIKNRKQAYNKRQSKQTNKKQQLKKISWHGSYSVAVPESHTVFTLFHIFLLLSVHCNVSLVWFEIPGCSSILVLHWDSSWISIVALCRGDHVVYICRSGPFM